MNHNSTLLVWAAVAVTVGCSSSSSSTQAPGNDSGIQSSGDSGTSPDSSSAVQDSVVGRPGLVVGGPGLFLAADGRPGDAARRRRHRRVPGNVLLHAHGQRAGEHPRRRAGTADPPPQLGAAITENGSAISAKLTTEGGASCTVTFADQGNGTALVNPGQSCMFPVTMPISTTVTIAFVAAAGDDAGPPGEATLSGNTITPNLPFHLTAAGGAATGEGDLTGTCTRM